MSGYTITVSEGIATLTLKLPGRANVIGEAFGTAVTAAITQLETTEGLAGVIVASGHKDFCAGADLDNLYRERDPAVIFEATTGLNELYRRLESLGVPVVAALTGAALGGGYELALACHHRIALDSPRIQIGLPEVSLGVIPGAGGTQRLPYLIGLQPALEHIAAGRPVRAPKAKKIGLVDALAPDVETLHTQAVTWIRENKGFKQPWDRSNFTFPAGVQPGSEMARNIFIGAAAFLYKKTHGCFPAAEAALNAIKEGTGLTFDRALEVEGRHFAKLATSDQAKDMIRTFFFHRNAVLKHEGQPAAVPHGFQRVAILGAGMMGASLGFVCAKAGLEVVVKDVSAEQLEKAQQHLVAQVKKLRHLDEATRDALTRRVSFTLEYADLEGVDLVIEAVPEIIGIKHAETRKIEPLLAKDGVWASNTSAIPITRLAEAAENKASFIGLHFFSPVEKMPLLEIILGEDTDERTLARCLSFGDAIKKTSIVVNDGYGFYTSRLFASYLMEGAQLVAEGHDPVLVEFAAKSQGMVMPPLKVFDEVSLALGVKAFKSRELILGDKLDYAGIRLVETLVEAGRNGKIVKQGFYDWETRRIWSGLSELVTATPETTGLEYLQRRLMLAQAAEIGRILDEGILRDHRDGDIGAIFGLGFAPNTGGPFAWIDRQGLPELVAELREFAEEAGERYTPSATLVRMAANGERFYEKV
ncbi:MAG TPA: 3-hydroxyacyl-CoA dehydrogenase NAD-binding domain-containing protein [Myxococcota bacterium]|nr:3-hydroxyacyl-CoA dehydrogenase NAD-binding domain-containing protein [Myxococcota bacterium]